MHTGVGHLEMLEFTQEASGAYKWHTKSKLMLMTQVCEPLGCLSDLHLVGLLWQNAFTPRAQVATCARCTASHLFNLFHKEQFILRTNCKCLSINALWTP
jgi:hypothetical protein